MTNISNLIKLLNIAHDEDALRDSCGIKTNGELWPSYCKDKLKELKKERADILKSLPLNNLTSTEKELFTLRFIKGKAVRAIAKKMYYSPSTIHHKIARICDKLSPKKAPSDE